MNHRDSPAATVLAGLLLLSGSVAVVLRAASRWLRKQMPGTGDGTSVERDWLGQPFADEPGGTVSVKLYDPNEPVPDGTLVLTVRAGGIPDKPP